MNYRKYSKFFWITLAAAILVDCAFDLMTLKQSYTTAETGRALNHTYQVLDEISAMGISLRDNIQARLNHDWLKSQESAAKLQKHYARYQTLTADTQAQRGQFNRFDFLNSSASTSEVAKVLESNASAMTSALTNARKTEERILEQHLELNERANIRSRFQIYVASALDLVLIFMAGIIWYIYDSSRRIEESKLTEAIEISQKSNNELQEILAKKATELRATVHDLKNPLGSIKGFSNLIEEERENPKSVAEMSQILQRIAAHTLELVNSLVEKEAQKWVEQSKTRIFDVMAYLEDVGTSLRPQLLQKQQLISFAHGAGPLEIRGHDKKIWDVFTNLIGNAMKFSPPGSIIKVISRQSNSHVIIEIEDQGPGFSAEDLKRAFGRYARLSARPTGGEPSSGLGLHISKEIITAHGGTIHIGNLPNRSGARITVSLPLPEKNRFTNFGAPTLSV